MSDELEIRSPYIQYFERVLEQIGDIPERSQWAFDLACVERTVVVYLWSWFLDDRPFPRAHLDTILSAFPYPRGPDFFGFRMDILQTLLIPVGNVVGERYDNSCDLAAERNILTVLGFLAVAYDLQQEVIANPLMLNHHLLIREVKRQQEDLHLLHTVPVYTRELGELMRRRSHGYDLFDGEWFPESKLL
jgi:hypothetical protein